MTYIAGTTIDTIFNQSLQLLRDEPSTSSRNGQMRQMVGCQIKLYNPAACVLQNTTRRANPSYAAGELLWYLRQSKSLEIIKHYTKNYGRFSDDGLTLNGAYGHRLGEIARSRGHEHFIPFIISWLCRDVDTRRLFLPIYQPQDVDLQSLDIPCTTGLQFVINNGKLDLVVNMRSNDVWLGLPYDIFCFCAIQCLVAFYGGFKLGTYTHSVGSLHLYDRNFDAAKEALTNRADSGKLLIAENTEERDFMTDLESALLQEQRNRANRQDTPMSCDQSLMQQIVQLASGRHQEEELDVWQFVF